MNCKRNFDDSRMRGTTEYLWVASTVGEPLPSLLYATLTVFMGHIGNRLMQYRVLALGAKCGLIRT